VGAEWEKSGGGVGEEWEKSRRGVGLGKEWERSGRGVGEKRERSGRRVGEEYKKSGRGVGEEWERSGREREQEKRSEKRGRGEGEKRSWSYLSCIYDVVAIEMKTGASKLRQLSTLEDALQRVVLALGLEPVLGLPVCFGHDGTISELFDFLLNHLGLRHEFLLRLPHSQSRCYRQHTYVRHHQ